MAWKWRKSHLYYYQNKRIGKRVISHYVGTMDTAAYAASIDQAERQARANERARRAAERAVEYTDDHATNVTLRSVQRLVADVLTTAGYHQHKRQWRKQRMPLTTEESAVLMRCSKPNASTEDVHALRRLFVQYPEKFRHVTNLLSHAEERIIESTQASAFICETLRSGCERVRAELGYAESPALERLLIDAVAMAWLRLALIEQQQTRALNGAHDPAMGRYWEQRLSSTHSRYVRAIEALARVRRLAVPALIQNIAANQTVQIEASKGS